MGDRCESFLLGVRAEVKLADDAALVTHLVDPRDRRLLIGGVCDRARRSSIDSQRIIMAKSSGITDLAGLRDQLICVLDMTPPERTLRDEMTTRGIKYALMAHSEQGEMDAAVAVRRCVAGTAMETRLAESVQTSMHGQKTSSFYQSGLRSARSFRHIATATKLSR